jgi:glucose-1-phosphatase
MITVILCDLGNVIVNVDKDRIVQGFLKFSDKPSGYIIYFLEQAIARSGFDKGKISAEQFFNRFKRGLGLELNIVQFKKIWCSGFSLNKNMEALLHKLKKHHKLVLLSNTDEMHFEYIKSRFKVLGIFDGFILSYKVGYKKPSPFMFLYAVRKLRTLPNHILYIDDIKTYTTIAKLFGIKAVQYTNNEKLKKDLIINSVKVV